MTSIMDCRKRKLYLEKAAAVAAALLVWQMAAMALDQKILLASPLEVVAALGDILSDGAWLRTIWFSLLRIASGFFLGLFFGTLLAVLAARFRVLEVLLWPYMAVLKATPVVSFIILCLVWLSAKNLSAFISFLMVLVVVYSNLLNGLRSMDGKLLEMARLFGMRPAQKLLAVYLPQLRPYLFAAFEISIGMAFKAGIAAEVIGVPDGSIGKMIYNAKIYLATPELFAWTFVLVCISVWTEKLAVVTLRGVYQNLEQGVKSVSKAHARGR